MRRLLIELRAALGSFGPASLTMLATVWAMLLGGAVLFAMSFSTRSTSLMNVMFAMGSFFTAFNLGASVPVMLADLHRLCAPGRLRTHAGKVLGALLLLTAVIPAVALALMQRSAEPARTIASAVLTGLLMARLSRGLGIAVIALAFLVVFLDSGMPGHFHSSLPALRELDKLLELRRLRELLQVQPWAQLAILAGLVVGLWRPVLAGNAAVLESAARRARAWRGGGQALSSWSSGWFPTTAPPDGSPRAPVHMVRRCLGPLYLPGSRAALRLVARAAILLGAFTTQFVLGLGWHRGWRVVVFLCLLMLWVASACR